MKIKYGMEMKNKNIEKSLTRLTNQVFKLLPLREEGLDWELPLSTIMVELSGMNELLIDQQDILFPLICKLEGLSSPACQNFSSYRRTVFECLGLFGDIKDELLR